MTFSSIALLFLQTHNKANSNLPISNLLNCLNTHMQHKKMHIRNLIPDLRALYTMKSKAKKTIKL